MAQNASNSERMAVRPEEWLQALNAHNVAYLALDLVEDRGLVEFFARHPGWAIDARDEQGVLFVRKHAASPPSQTANGPTAAAKSHNLTEERSIPRCGAVH